MIEILRIEAIDTFSYRHLIFDFTSGLHSIEGENGSSKTSIFLALIHCLVNKNPKGCKVDDVSNKITGLPYEIRVTAKKDEAVYLFINSKKSGTVEIKKDDRDISLKRIPDNLKMIQEILGADFQLLCDLLYQSKDSTLDILETGTDSRRKQFINRILRMAEIDEQALRMKDKEKEIGGKNGRVAFLEKQIENLQLGLGEIREVEPEVGTLGTECEISALTAEIAELTEKQRDMESGLRHIELQIATAEGEHAIRDRIASLEANHAKIPNWFKGFPGSCQPSPAENVRDAQSQLEDWQAKIHALKLNASALRNDLARAYKAQEQLNLLDQYKAGLAEIPKPDKDKAECLDQLAKIQRVNASTGTKVEEIWKKLESYRKSVADKVCPTCGSAENWERIQGLIVDLENEEGELKELQVKCKNGTEKYTERLRLHERREKIEAEIAKLSMVAAVELSIPKGEERLQSFEKEIVSLEESVAEVKEWIADYHRAKELEVQIEKLRGSLKGTEISEAMYLAEEGAKAGLKQIRELLAEKQERSNHLQQRLESSRQHNAMVKAQREMNRQIEERNTAIQAQIEQMKLELSEAEDRLDCVKEWLGILGNKGFRVARINRFLKSLNATMVKYSQMICNGRISCVFFISPEGEIEFSISDSAKEMDYPLWSGGEKARIRMVCLFAVLELLEVMGSVSFNVLCLDEVFDQLDNDGKEGLFRVLEYLKSKGKAVYVIAHSELTLDLNYDSVVRAVKHQDGTTEILQ